jgi:hypothetical protein
VFPSGHLLTPFSEPDVQLSLHPALQGFSSLRFFRSLHFRSHGTFTALLLLVDYSATFNPLPSFGLWLAFPTSDCRVGGGRAAALPPSARSNGSYSFPVSRFPWLLRHRSHRLTRPGMRWVSRTKPRSSISRRVGYLRHIPFRHRLARNEYKRCSIHRSNRLNNRRTCALR